ncbi:hypothetical protein [Paucimonas lemoignei]|nr:hypothetical protein [Paucimonas lemoignei]
MASSNMTIGNFIMRTDPGWYNPPTLRRGITPLPACGNGFTILQT